MHVTHSVSSKNDGLNHNTTLAHIIPPEILTEIFIQYNRPFTPIVYLPPARNLYPWILGHICSRWREALWMSSRIWSIIKVHKPTLLFSHDEGRVQTMFDYLISHTTGLISLSILRDSYSPLGVSNLLLSSSDRLRDLSFSFFSPSVFLGALLELPPGSLNQLEYLCFEAASTSPKLLSHPTDYTRLPRLRRLSVDGYTPIVPYIHHFPSSQLESLSITGSMITPILIRLLLQQCTSLTSAEFWISDEIDDPPGIQITGPIISPLESLNLCVCFSFDWGPFLAALFLPSLKRISCVERVDTPIGFGPTFPRAMVSLFLRSKCSLDSFTIRYHIESDFFPLPEVEPPHPDIIDLLQTTRGLKSLISEYVAPPALLTAVHSGLLPHLTSVNWRVYPTGLCILLDLLDAYVTETPRDPFRYRIDIVCCNEEGFSLACRRYNNSYEVYAEAGIQIIVRDSRYEDVRSPFCR